MEIRSVTFFVNPLQPLGQLAAAAAAARRAFDLPVQTIRLATTPFPTWLNGGSRLSDLVHWCSEQSIDYLSLGPVRLDDPPENLERAVAAIAAHDRVFASAEIADRKGRLDTGRIGEVAEVIRWLSRVQANGFSNLYFTATANCPAGSPFFPVSFHGGGAARFAIATEAADLAVSAFQGADTLQEARDALVAAIESAGGRIQKAAEPIARNYGLEFGGIDFSLAPFPENARSLGAALEALGVPAVGAHGSLFAAALLAECVDRASVSRCGFSGLMFPVLEDAVLARRAAEGACTVRDLLLYSAVCGAGLDTVPLPGDATQEELAAILLDVAALALRLDKPLTARLMPLPGKAAGDPVVFDFPYFADSRVMDLSRMGLSGPMARAERITVHSRRWSD